MLVRVVMLVVLAPLLAPMALRGRDYALAEMTARPPGSGSHYGARHARVSCAKTTTCLHSSHLHGHRVSALILGALSTGSLELLQ